jgi:nucleotide-binding universal stress UspA family protein
MLTREHIVVGVSRSPAGAAALRWALDAAAAQGWEVVAVHSFDLSVRADARLERDLDAEARESARRAQVWVQQVAPNDAARRLLEFRSRAGEIGETLAKESRGAVLLVMGVPTLTRHGDLAARLRQRCTCPVILVDENGEAVVESTPDRPESSLSEALDTSSGL